MKGLTTVLNLGALNSFHM